MFYFVTILTDLFKADTEFHISHTYQLKLCIMGLNFGNKLISRHMCPPVLNNSLPSILVLSIFILVQS